jgi:hypothetical protein
MHVTATITPADRANERAGGQADGPQYMHALQRANQVRLARAVLKRRVADGEIQAAEVILDCPWEAQSMAVADLLMSQRRWGATRSRKIMAPPLAREDDRLTHQPTARRPGSSADPSTGSRAAGHFLLGNQPRSFFSSLPSFSSPGSSLTGTLRLPHYCSVNDSVLVLLSFPAPLISVSVYLPGWSLRSRVSRRLMRPRVVRAVPFAYTTP